MGLINTLFGAKDARAPLAPIQDMIEAGLVTVAAQPKNNALNLNDRKLERLYVFLIDHDYPGGSAAMHNAVFARYKLPYRSCFMIGDPANVGDIYDGLRSCSIFYGGGAGSGFKDKIAPSLHGLAPSAKVIGSVNVIARENHRFIGHNTDGVGFVAGLLNEYANCVAGKKVVILGAGGTALPISYELAKQNPSEVVIVNRTVAKGQTIADLIAPLTSAGRALGCRPEVVFQKKNARILLDQIRCVDKVRLGKKMGKVDEKLWHAVLLEMLA